MLVMGVAGLYQTLTERVLITFTGFVASIVEAILPTNSWNDSANANASKIRLRSRRNLSDLRVCVGTGWVSVDAAAVAAAGC